mmetsp:Transcript_7474/g.17801  ORF Transcript_7474/g.17801 Transcript_7474/m.17801 type:complete len:252 (+) Transcript_7474:253-1008(+)
MQLHKLGDVKLGLLQNLDLADQAVLEWKNGLALLLNVFTDGLRDQLPNQISELHFPGFLRDDLHHPFANLADLRRLRVGVCLDLVAVPACESDAKQAYNVVVRRLDIDMCLYQRLPLLDQGADLVPRKRHAMKICEAAPALHFLNGEPDLLRGLVFVVLKVRKVYLQDPALELLCGNLRTLCPRDQGFTALPNREHAGCLDVIPLLPQEGVTSFLLATFLAAFREALVLAHSHGCVSTRETSRKSSLSQLA